ncbi:Dyp-type peroxidase [Undibacterium luofuense]|uniref:Peroxidase n=1 Tax=Undibacterium luofuense TaxID=2828733 RepID=A0A941I5H9_9BURK|nr:peroxidase [Undibacterium luofuense]MBR7780535.1 peroxidase [Undibacterium luofuense]
MTATLDLADIQGHVLRAYARFGYPTGRYVFLNVTDAAAARRFLTDILPHLTTAVCWGEGKNEMAPPDLAVNLAFTYQGLKAVELPRASLMGFSPEFAEGMKARQDILGDDGVSAPEHWDPVWRDHLTRRDKDVHIAVLLHARMPAPAANTPEAIALAFRLSQQRLDQGLRWLRNLIADSGDGVTILGGHRGPDGELLDYQDVQTVLENGIPTAKEHFGYTDGIGDPVIAGVPYDADRVAGRGKQMDNGQWEPLAPGEFIFGHLDEAQEYPPAPLPRLLARNGTYMVYRKLHENIASFDAFLEREAAKAYPFEGGKELLAAKFVGRWRDNGAPLVTAPDPASKKAFDQRFAAASAQEQDKMLSDFTYDQDMSGARCPFSGHIRRINPRASLELGHQPGDPPGSFSRMNGAFDTPGALANRRRLMRRGLPYGEVRDRSRNDGNHGIIIMLLNADIARQFEFVQQQWVNYGNDFHAGNDKEIILGNHSADTRFASKAVLQVEPTGDQVPYLLGGIPRLVETRGGEYFFIPGMTALRMIARGIIDPT